MTGTRPITLSVPPQKLDALTFCDGSLRALDAWAAPLYAMAPAEAIDKLLPALVELNQCKAAADTRFKQLEILRPVVHFLCSRLTQEMLKRPMLLDAREQQALGAAQSLQTHLAAGYKVVLAGSMQSGQGVHTEALHRAISELGQTLLRALQLYTPAPQRLWLQLHQLYYLAERKGALEATAMDPDQSKSRPTSIRTIYMRLLLLGCARPNMLRQQALGALFNALESWAEKVEFGEPESDDPLLVDLTSDRAPVESARYTTRADEDRRCLKTEALLNILRHRFEQATSPGSDFSGQGADDAELLSHLIQAWSRSARRAFKRSRAQGKLEICIGLPALHFHSAGGIPLKAQLRGRRSLRHEDRDEDLVLDPFAGAGDVGGARQEPARVSTGAPRMPAEDTHFPISSLQLDDISPGGYGLVWSSQPDAELHAGELVGLRKPGDAQWSVAVVRWCRNQPGELRLGVELLAPRAASACIRPLGQNTAWNAWGPALVLPEVSALGQPPYLITEGGAFSPGQKVMLNQYGSGLRARLEVLERTSHGFAEFRFESLGDHSETTVHTGIEVDYLDDETEIELTGTGPWSEQHGS
ncbi:MAG: hypothetical protein JJT88_15580 [Gammaproteobacteria bacterium]|nr:hypothetical protein [Gammaproteobacteria bacterium]